MLGNINNNKAQGLSNQASGSNGSAGSSGSGVQLAGAVQQVSGMRSGGEQASTDGSIQNIKNEINALYVQLADIEKGSVGPNEATQNPWTSGPQANYETGQKEKIMALIRVKEEKMKAVEQYGGGKTSNRAAFDNLFQVYTQMEDMAKLQDFDPSYKGFNSISMTTNSYVGDQMTKLRSMAEIYKAQIANS